ncbi:MAG: hypothetical protein ACI4DP_10995 [Candidatus Ornithomonoglobus sp.]
MDISNEISTFQFISSDVTNVDIQNNLFFCNLPKDTWQRTFDVDYDIEYVSNENNRWSGILGLTFSLSIDSSENDERIFSFKISVKGVFVAPISMTQEEFEGMLELNGLTALYSVARGTIASISSDVTNFERILLPMLNIKKLVDKKHSETQDVNNNK